MTQAGEKKTQDMAPAEYQAHVSKTIHTQQWLIRRIQRATTLTQLQNMRDDMGYTMAKDPLIKIEMLKREKEIRK